MPESQARMQSLRVDLVNHSISSHGIPLTNAKLSRLLHGRCELFPARGIGVSRILIVAIGFIHVAYVIQHSIVRRCVTSCNSLAHPLNP